MKTVLKISILTNLVLLAGLVLLRLGNQPKPITELPQPAITTTHMAETGKPPVNLEPFQWRQLYAKDYHVYVKNLRATGCPERTLRAIVSADVHAGFQQRIDELEKNLSGLSKGSWTDQLGAWKSREALKKKLLQLPDEEAATLADCLGEKIAGSAAATLARTTRTKSARVEEPIVAPLVAQPVDILALHLDSGQLQAITDLQQSFLQKIGGADQDPNDPDYRARWRLAQAEVDNLMQGMLGDQAYQDYQLQVFANAQAKPVDASTPETTEN